MCFSVSWLVVLAAIATLIAQGVPTQAQTTTGSPSDPSNCTGDGCELSTDTETPGVGSSGSSDASGNGEGSTPSTSSNSVDGEDGSDADTPSGSEGDEEDEDDEEEDSFGDYSEDVDPSFDPSEYYLDYDSIPNHQIIEVGDSKYHAHKGMDYYPLKSNLIKIEAVGCARISDLYTCAFACESKPNCNAATFYGYLFDEPECGNCEMWHMGVGCMLPEDARDFSDPVMFLLKDLGASCPPGFNHDTGMHDPTAAITPTSAFAPGDPPAPAATDENGGADVAVTTATRGQVSFGANGDSADLPDGADGADDAPGGARAGDVTAPGPESRARGLAAAGYAAVAAGVAALAVY